MIVAVEVRVTDASINSFWLNLSSSRPVLGIVGISLLSWRSCENRNSIYTKAWNTVGSVGSSQVLEFDALCNVSWWSLARLTHKVIELWLTCESLLGHWGCIWVEDELEIISILSNIRFPTVTVIRKTIKLLDLSFSFIALSCTLCHSLMSKRHKVFSSRHSLGRCHHQMGILLRCKRLWLKQSWMWLQGRWELECKCFWTVWRSFDNQWGCSTRH